MDNGQWKMDNSSSVKRRKAPSGQWTIDESLNMF